MTETSKGYSAPVELPPGVDLKSSEEGEKKNKFCGIDIIFWKTGTKQRAFRRRRGGKGQGPSAPLNNQNARELDFHWGRGPLGQRNRSAQKGVIQ